MLSFRHKCDEMKAFLIVSVTIIKLHEAVLTSQSLYTNIDIFGGGTSVTLPTRLTLPCPIKKWHIIIFFSTIRDILEAATLNLAVNPDYVPWDCGSTCFWSLWCFALYWCWWHQGPTNHTTVNGNLTNHKQRSLLLSTRVGFSDITGIHKNY